MEEIKVLEEENKKLKKKIKNLEAQSLTHRYFSLLEMNRFNMKDYIGSALIVTIEDLNGRKLLDNVAINNGLSEETYELLKKDLARGMLYTLEIIDMDKIINTSDDTNN